MNEIQTKQSQIEQQIDEQQKFVKYDIREFTIEYYVNKYCNKLEKGENEIYIPDYQREFVWDKRRQSRFIESLFLGLPIPLLFVAENESDGRMEVVDGSQRIRTLAAFVNGELTLDSLKKLTELNGISFQMLSQSRQRKFKNISMRMIVLSTQASEEIRNEMFDRINTSAVSLLPMETRRGIYRGPFMDFITKLAGEKKFKSLCRLNQYMENRREEEELILRFFAFSETYPVFKTEYANLNSDGVALFLDKYLAEKNKLNDTHDMEIKERQLFTVVDFIEKYFPDQGFSKAKGIEGVSRPYFEAIAIGALLAIQEKGELVPKDLSWTIVNKNNINDLFRILSSRYHTHTPERLLERIDYAKNKYLES